MLGLTDGDFRWGKPSLGGGTLYLLGPQTPLHPMKEDLSKLLPFCLAGVNPDKF